MRGLSLGVAVAVVSMFAGIVAAGPALAEKPAWVGGRKAEHQQSNVPRQEYGRQQRQDRGSSHESMGREQRGRHHFSERQRASIQEYFTHQLRRGRCPPGLAKKHNGCMPPGQARKWAVGRPLPRDVTFYNLPHAVVEQLGPPPAGSRYARVGQDILLLATGTGMVLDAIQDLNWQFKR